MHQWCATSLKWRVRNEKPEMGHQIQTGLVNHLMRLSGKASGGVLRQLCAALVALVEQNPSAQLVAQLCSSFSSNPQTLPVLLLFLRSLGVEACRLLTSLQHGEDAERADDPEISNNHPLLVSVRPNAETVMNLLHQGWAAEADKTSERAGDILHIFAKWLRLCDTVDPALLVNSPITQVSPDLLSSHTTAADAASWVISELAELVGHDAARYAAVADFLKGNLMKIGGFLGGVRNDDDYAALLTRSLFDSLCAFAPMLAHVTPDALQIVQIAVQASAYPDTSVVQSTMRFWCKLQRVVSQLPDQQRPQAQQQLGSVVSPIITHVLTHAMYPADEWGTEDKSEHKSFRDKDLVYLAQDITLLARPSHVLQVVYPQFQAVAADPQRSREAEALLWFIGCALDSADDVDRGTAYAAELAQEMHTLQDQLLPQLLGNPNVLAQQPWLTKAEYLRIVSRVAYWIPQGGNDAMLTGILEFIINSCLSIAVPAMQHITVKTISVLCEECTTLVLPLFSMLDQKLQADSANLPNEEAENIMYSLACLSCELPLADMRQAVASLCEPTLRRVQASAMNAGIVAAELNKLVAQFKGVDSVKQRWLRMNERAPSAISQDRVAMVENSWCEAFGHIWEPTMKQLVIQYAEDEQVMESLTSMLRIVMHVCGLRLTSFLESLVGCICQCFDRRPQSCLLWLLGTVISVFGSHEQYVAPIMGVLTDLIGKAVQVLAKQGNVGPYSDFIQEIYYLFILSLRTFPTQLMHSPLASGVFDVGMAALTNTDVTSKAIFEVLKFFETALDDTTPAICQLTNQFLAADNKTAKLTEALLHCVVYRCLDTSDTAGLLLYNLHKMYGLEAMRPWFHHGLLQLPQEVPMKAREACMKDFFAQTSMDAVYKLFERLHRSAPRNWK